MHGTPLSGLSRATAFRSHAHACWRPDFGRHYICFHRSHYLSTEGRRPDVPDHVLPVAAEQRRVYIGEGGPNADHRPAAL
jgi:hypothetical protein